MENFQLSFEAIGTQWVIDCYNSPVKKEKVLESLLWRAEVFDKTYSRFRKDSFVWKISEKPGSYEFPPDSKKFFDLYEKLNKITSGKFTLLIGNTLSEAGYDSSYSLKPGKLNKVPESSSIYSWKYPTLIVKKPYILDFGGLGKGYLVDIFSDLLTEKGIKSFCVDGGGDMYCTGLPEPLRVGLENPLDFKQVIGVIEISGNSICASSGNRRRWDKYHHIINPETLNSPDEILATWVVAKDAITADGLATCLFLESPHKLAKYFDFEYLILKPDFTFQKSKNFSAELFLK
jgi:thiamine biosynthesis lipoprotein